MAWTIEYAVQAGWARIVSFIWLLPLAGHGATKSGVDRHVVGIAPLHRRLCLLRWGLPLLFLASEVPGSLALLLLRSSQLSSPMQRQVISAVRAAMDFGFSWPRCRASHPSRMLCLKAARASTSRHSMIWFFLVTNLVQNFLVDSPGY